MHPHSSILNIMSEIYLTAREAAAELGVSYPTIKQWILKGRIVTQKTPGGHHRIARKAIDYLLPSTQLKATGPSRDRFRVVSGRNQLWVRSLKLKLAAYLRKSFCQLVIKRSRPLLLRMQLVRCNSALANVQQPS